MACIPTNFVLIRKIVFVLKTTGLVDVLLFNITYRIIARDATHIISRKKIENDFIDCKLIGKRSLENLVAKFVHNKPFGSIDHLRKELNVKKILPIITKKKYIAKPKLPLSNTEKKTLLMNYSDEDIPKLVWPCLVPVTNLHLTWVVKRLNLESLSLRNMQKVFHPIQ